MFFFFFKQKTAYEISACLVGSEMCIRDRDDIRMQAELEAKKQKEQKEQMPKKIGDRIQWARERSEEHNAQIKKNKTKYRGMEL